MPIWITGIVHYGDMIVRPKQPSSRRLPPVPLIILLAMAATRAVLQRILEEGEALQEALNERTRRFVETVNAFFAQEQVPFEMAHFGSLFRFTWNTSATCTSPWKWDRSIIT